MPFTNNERVALVKECGKVTGELQALTAMLAMESLSPPQVAAQADKVSDAAAVLFDHIASAQD